jgi:hypothetical protein
MTEKTITVSHSTGADWDQIANTEFAWREGSETAAVNTLLYGIESSINFLAGYGTRVTGVNLSKARTRRDQINGMIFALDALFGGSAQSVIFELHDRADAALLKAESTLRRK